MSTDSRTARSTHDLASALRDGLLQDLLAIAMLLAGARGRSAGRGPTTTADELLATAAATLTTDIHALRTLIRCLSAAHEVAAAGGAADAHGTVIPVSRRA